MTLSRLKVAWPEETDQAPAKEGHGGRKPCSGTALKNQRGATHLPKEPLNSPDMVSTLWHVSTKSKKNANGHSW